MSSTKQWQTQARQLLESKGQILQAIIAQNQDGAIGVGMDLPWHIPEDLAFFKQTTMQAQLILGRTTFQSIGRPLPGRRLLVLSRTYQAADLHPAIEVASTPLAALDLLVADRPVFIAGGARVYELFEDLIDRYFITLVRRELPEATEFYDALDFVQSHNFQQTAEQELTDEARVLCFERQT